MTDVTSHNAMTASPLEAFPGLDPEQLRRLSLQLASSYQTAQPFPHTVIDNLLPSHVASRLVADFPGPDAHPWHTYRNARELKLMGCADAAMPSSIRTVLRELNAATFVEFLEALTGIQGLIPDPHLVGGGMHQIQRGGFLRVHADFNRHPRLGLYRRLNVLVYLNPGWTDDFGGHLELWNRDMTRCEARIAPVLNRCVIFNTTSESFHGHPAPLTCPNGVTRRSLALYYYTHAPAETQFHGRDHSTLFRRVPGEPFSIDRELVVAKATRVARQVAPPILFNGAKAVRQRRRRPR